MWRRLKTFFAENRGTAAGGGAEVPNSLSREQELLELIESRDGRIRQSDIAAATDCSESTVSRTLTRMEEEHLIHRVSIGREKVVLLPSIASELGIDDET